jgi:hypothetical protein
MVRMEMCCSHAGGFKVLKFTFRKFKFFKMSASLGQIFCSYNVRLDSAVLLLEYCTGICCEDDTNVKTIVALELLHGDFEEWQAKK